MTQQITVVPLDSHGHLPRMHYDALWKPSPTTRADIVAWCIALRNEHKVSKVLSGSVMITMAAAMKKKAPHSRLGDLPAAQLGAIEAAADKLYAIVKEYGYDPTDVEAFREPCMSVVLENIDSLTYDLAEQGEALAGLPSLLELLHKQISIAAVATTMMSALAGQTNPKTMLNSLLLAIDESNNLEIKEFLSETAAKLKQVIDRKSED